MPLMRTKRGGLTEEWVQTDWVDGGDAQQIDTDILIPSTSELDNVDIMLVVSALVGAPLISDPVRSEVGGKLRVAFNNTAAPGNKFKYRIKLVLVHSIVR